MDNFKVYNNKGEEISKEQAAQILVSGSEWTKEKQKKWMNSLEEFIVRNGGEILK